MQPGTFIFPVRREAFAKTVGLPVWPAQANNPKEMARLYTAMHRNILDVFNEHGVQIMTPAYEGVPKYPRLFPGINGTWSRQLRLRLRMKKGADHEACIAGEHAVTYLAPAVSEWWPGPSARPATWTGSGRIAAEGKPVRIGRLVPV